MPSHLLRSALIGSLEELVRRRKQIAAVYAEAAGRLGVLTPQVVATGNRHCWVHWVGRVAPELGRDHLASWRAGWPASGGHQALMRAGAP